MNPVPFSKKEVLGIRLNTISFEKGMESILHLARNQQQAYVCFANAHMTVEAHRDQSFAQVVNQANLTFPDGMPLVWAIKQFHKVEQERIAGMDAFPYLLERAEMQQLAVYFYGSTPKVLQAIEDRAKRIYPNLNIVGSYSPPFSNFTETAQQQAIDQINQSNADLVFVALGCPKQEKWMAKYSSEINAVLLGVGGAFPVFAEQQNRAPQWMRKVGMEWFFRFLQEPQRLWKRYLITNMWFMWLFVKAIINKRN